MFTALIDFLPRHQRTTSERILSYQHGSGDRAKRDRPVTVDPATCISCSRLLVHNGELSAIGQDLWLPGMSRRSRS
jgi:hypothetical protein